jgi:sulfatase maturation enzyme AslB (radical SAM superfamily)
MTKRDLTCVLAHSGLGLHNSGRTYLCCHSRKYLEDESGQQIYLDTHTLQDAWSSPTRREIQQALDSGVEHPSCQACWDDEHAGKLSRREHFNRMWQQDFGEVKLRKDQPQFLDLKMGNTCNMRCRTCNPEVSSQWYREDWLLNAGPKEGISYAEYLPRWRRITASYSDDNQDLWNTLTQWLPNTLYIDYYGAEPMLIKKNFEVMEQAVRLGTAKDITIHINTNGTVWSDYHEQLLKQFRHIYIDVSIDDIGSRCGYIRYSSEWELVSANLERFIALAKSNSNFNLSVCVTINSLNVYYLDEIFDYFCRKQIVVNPNMLHLPWQLNCKVLPDQVKQAVVKKLQSYSPEREWHQVKWESIKNMVCQFIMTSVPEAQNHFEEFHRYTRGLDNNRGQCFETDLPEFAALIRPWFDQLDKAAGR